MSKRHIRVLSKAVLGAVLVVALSSCGGERSSGAVKITDLAGREVAVPENVERILPLGPGALRFVTYLGAVERVVGIEDMENRMATDIWIRPYARKLDKTFFEKPVVGAGGPGKLPDFEKVILCRPDVIVAVSIERSQVENIQSKTGIPTVYLTYGELGVWRGECQESLKLLGKILGRQERAEQINSYIALQQKDLAKRTEDMPEGEMPSAYFGGISFKGSHGITSTQAGYPPGCMVNARNLADGSAGQMHMFVDKEQLMVWDPDIIFIDIGSKTIVYRDFQANRDFYRMLTASRSGNVYSLLPYNYYNTNIELALINACFIGKCIYPARFEDVDIAEKADEIIGVFLGLKMEGDMPAYRTVRFPEQGPAEWE